MKYLCLIYHEVACLEAVPGAEYNAIMAGALDYREELRVRGYDIASASLQPAHATTTIRVRNGRVQISDGPAAGTTEQLGEFYLIDATDLNDAIRVITRMPSARIGSIEVRPLRDLDEERVRQECRSHHPQP